MTQEEMYEKSFERPRNYFKLSMSQQWDIDKKLGLLDWMPVGMTQAQIERFRAYYDMEYL